MIANLHPYPAYKSSGVKWLGDVPVHWEVAPLKHWVRVNEVVLSETTESSFEFAYLEIGAVSNGQLVEQPHRIRFSDAPSRARRIVRMNDTIISTVRTYLKAVWFAEEPNDHLICSTGFAVLTPSKGNEPKYVSYLVRSDSFTDQVTAESVGIAYPAISEVDLNSLRVCVPPLPEQSAIARYLDHTDSRIQRYISVKERLIELLTEQKQAIINQAVTRGLDPNVPLKPSGVDWLGDVPTHWKRCRLRNAVSVVTTGSRGWSSYASDTGPLFIRIANLERGSLRLRFNDVVRLNMPKTSEAARTRIRAGDLLVSVTAYIGSVGIASKELGEAYVSQHVARCQPRRGMSSEWLGYVLLSEVGQTHGQISLYGGTKDGLSLDDVKNYPTLLPPLGEQTAIVEFLDKATADIEAAISRTRRQIDLMQEYRTRLIADVVTGKLDVRGAAAQLPDETKDLYDAQESAEEMAIESEVTA